MADTRNVQQATNGAVGFDCSAKLTAKTAAGLHDQGFEFAVRYLTRRSTPPAGDLDPAEVDLILKAGLALMAVQHVESNFPPGWTPSEAKGKEYGANAASHAKAVGLPAGVTLWVDLEGIADGVSADEIIKYCNAWFAEVSQAGYDTGVYVGAQCRLDGEELYWSLHTKRYWRSGSKVPDVAHRGYCMTQRIKSGDVVAGVGIDRNIVKTDALGGLPSWLTAKVMPAAAFAQPASMSLLSAAAVSSTTAGLDPTFGANLAALLAKMKAAGHDFRLSQGLRSAQTQAQYYCSYAKRSPKMIQARADELRAKNAPWIASLLELYKNMPRKKEWLTNALPGAGWHQWGLAADCYCYVDGKMVEDGGDPRYKLFADTAIALGMTAGYYFKDQDSGHVQGRKEGGASDVYDWAEIDRVMKERFGDKPSVALNTARKKKRNA